MKLYQEIIWVAIATAGGVARYLNILLVEKTPEFQVLRLIARAVIGGFSGYMFAQFSNTFINSSWDVFAAGIGGWLGADGIDYLAQRLKGRIESNGKH